MGVWLSVMLESLLYSYLLMFNILNCFLALFFVFIYMFSFEMLLYVFVILLNFKIFLNVYL